MKTGGRLSVFPKLLMTWFVMLVNRFISELHCPSPAAQKNGHRGNCPESFLYKGQCQFECDDGYELPAGRTSLIRCTDVSGSMTTVGWDNTPSACTGTWLPF